MRRIALTMLCCGLAAVAAPALAATSVEARLAARDIKFEKDKDGDYRIVYHYEKEDRTQIVYVGGTTEKVPGFEVREVFAPAGNIEGDHIDGAKALQLLENSRAAKLGSWEIAGKTLYYVIKLPDDVDAATLETALDIAATQADDMETQLSGDDDEY